MKINKGYESHLKNFFHAKCSNETQTPGLK